MRDGISIKVSTTDRERLVRGGGGRQQFAEACVAGADHSGDGRGCGGRIMRHAGIGIRACGAGKNGLCARGLPGCCATERANRCPPAAPAAMNRVVSTLTLASRRVKQLTWTGRAMAAASGLFLRCGKRLWGRTPVCGARCRMVAGAYRQSPAFAAKLRDVVGLYQTTSPPGAFGERGDNSGARPHPTRLADEAPPRGR